MKTRALALLVLFAGTPLPAFTPRPGAEAPRPNFVFILVDDLGWTDVGVYGSTFYETPNIDSLARRGMRFTSAYAAAPVCSPTRASILTGKYPARLNQTDWIAGRGDYPNQRLRQVEDLNYLPLEEVTLAEALREAGYATAHIGKWHLGSAGYLPEDQGFDVNVGGNHNGSPPTFFYPYQRGEHTLRDLAWTGREGENLTDRLAEEAVRFIEAHRDEPFFLHLPFYAVHIPLEAKPGLVQKYQRKADNHPIPDSAAFGTEGGRPVRQIQNHPVYAAMVETMDAAVGRVLQALETNGLAEHTVVVFFSDNGGLSTAERLPTSNVPLRAGKGYLYEGGIREPLIVRWPGVTPPGSLYHDPVTSVDFFPTILEMAGLTVPNDASLDGISLVPVLRGGRVDRGPLYWHYPHYSNQGGTPGGAIRDGDYKLIEFYEDEHVELYNLTDDLGERRDLAAAMPDKAAALRRKLDAWRASVSARMPVPNPDHGGTR